MWTPMIADCTGVGSVMPYWPSELKITWALLISTL
jgi:hypothetical protein